MTAQEPIDGGGPASPADGGAGHAPPDWRASVEVGRFGLARQTYGLAGGDDPAVRTALAGLADVEANVRDKAWQRALKRLRAIEERPEVVRWGALERDLETLVRSGEALDRRRPDDAQAELSALSTTYFEAEAWTQRGTALIFDDRLPEAEAAFERALEVDPNHYRALTNLGNVALEDGRVDDAIVAYERALKLNDDFANAHHNLGVAYRRKGQVGRSVRELRKAQRSLQRRDAVEAREKLGSVAGRRGGQLFRWLLYAAAAAVLLWILHARGMI